MKTKKQIQQDKDIVLPLLRKLVKYMKDSPKVLYSAEKMRDAGQITENEYRIIYMVLGSRSIGIWDQDLQWVKREIKDIELNGV